MLQLADRNFILPAGLFHYIIYLHSPAKPGVAFALKLTTQKGRPLEGAAFFVYSFSLRRMAPASASAPRPFKKSGRIKGSTHTDKLAQSPMPLTNMNQTVPSA